jgi:hypothetical protein
MVYKPKLPLPADVYYVICTFRFIGLQIYNNAAKLKYFDDP